MVERRTPNASAVVRFHVGPQMESKEVKTFFEKALGYGYANAEGFTQSNIFSSLNPSETESAFLKHHFLLAQNAQNNAGIFVYTGMSKHAPAEHVYTLNKDMLLGFIELEDLKLTRKTAVDAKWQAQVATVIALFSLLSTILIPIFVTQTVNLSEGSLNALRN